MANATWTQVLAGKRILRDHRTQAHGERSAPVVSPFDLASLHVVCRRLRGLCVSHMLALVGRKRRSRLCGPCGCRFVRVCPCIARQLILWPTAHGTACGAKGGRSRRRHGRRREDASSEDSRCNERYELLTRHARSGCRTMVIIVVVAIDENTSGHRRSALRKFFARLRGNAAGFRYRPLLLRRVSEIF